MIIRNLKTLALCSVVALSFGMSAANAQNVETLNAEVEVLNDITITEAVILNFGQIGLTTAAGQTPSIELETDGSFNITAAGGAAIVEIGGSAPGEVTLTAAAGAAVGGVTINMEIDNAVNLAGPGPDEFVLSDFTYDDGTNDGAVAFGTPVDVLLDGAGVANLLIGATITAADDGEYADGAYAGTYDMTVYY